MEVFFILLSLPDRAERAKLDAQAAAYALLVVDNGFLVFKADGGAAELHAGAAAAAFFAVHGKRRLGFHVL